MESIDSQITELVLDMKFSPPESIEGFKAYARRIEHGGFNDPHYYELLHEAISLNHAFSGAINSALAQNERNELILNRLVLDTRGLVLSALCEHDTTQKKAYIRSALENFLKQLQLMGEISVDIDSDRAERTDIQRYIKMCETIIESV